MEGIPLCFIEWVLHYYAKNFAVSPSASPTFATYRTFYIPLYAFCADGCLGIQISLETSNIGIEACHSSQLFRNTVLFTAIKYTALKMVKHGVCLYLKAYTTF